MINRNIKLINREIRLVYRKIEMETKEITETLVLKKYKHWHVIGVIGQLRKTGVHIVVPPKDSREEGITLRGTQDQVARAKEIINNVTPYTEYVDAPFWAKDEILIWLRSNSANYPKLKIKLYHLKQGDQTYTLSIYGSIRNKVQECREEFKSLINGLKITEIDIHLSFYEYLLNNRRMCNSVSQAAGGVHIDLQNATKDYPKPYIFIGGQPKKVDMAADDMKQKVDEFRCVQVAFEKRYHGDLIGKGGENIHKIRVKFPQVMIALPDRAMKRDVVFVSGPKAGVDGACKYLQELRVEFLETKPQYERRLQEDRHDHYIIIGYKGETIRRLRRTHKVDITVPAWDTDDQTVVIAAPNEQDVDNAEAAILDEIRSVIEYKRQEYERRERDRRAANPIVTIQPASNNNQTANKGKRYFNMRNMAL